jgi:hypothetical protein
VLGGLTCWYARNGASFPPCASMNFTNSIASPRRAVNFTTFLGVFVFVRGLRGMLVLSQNRIYGGGFGAPTAKVEATLNGDSTLHAIEI